MITKIFMINYPNEVDGGFGACGHFKADISKRDLEMGIINYKSRWTREDREKVNCRDITDRLKKYFNRAKED